jgi:hypothetical protein
VTSEVLETADLIFRQDHFCQAWLQKFNHLSNFVLTQVKNLQALHFKRADLLANIAANQGSA